MKTIFIYDQTEWGPLLFFVAEGDYSHLDRVYVNYNDTAEQANQLGELLGYGSAPDWINGEYPEFLTKFPVEEARKGAVVVTIGIVQQYKSSNQYQ